MAKCVVAPRSGQSSKVIRSASNTSQLEAFVHTLWRHQQKNEFCDFTLAVSKTSIECHKVVLSSASPYFNQLFLSNTERSFNIIDVSHVVSLQVLKVAVAFMYNSEYSLEDDYIIDLLKLSEKWELDVLTKQCVEYMNDNINVNNACMFYSFALKNNGYNDVQKLNSFIREHFTDLHELNQFYELSTTHYCSIIEHDDINVDNEDILYRGALETITNKTSLNSIKNCLALIRFHQMTANFLLDGVQPHPMMDKQLLDNYVKDALRCQLTQKTTATTVKPPRCWQTEIYYIGKDQYIYLCHPSDKSSVDRQVIQLPGDMNGGESVDFHPASKRLVIAGEQVRIIYLRGNLRWEEMPKLPTHIGNYHVGVGVTDDGIYIVGGDPVCHQTPDQHTYDPKVDQVSFAAHYLSFQDRRWKPLPQMPRRVSNPLVIAHKHYLYVLGGRTYGRRSMTNQYWASRYCIATKNWMTCKDIPISCSRDDVGAVIIDGKINLISSSYNYEYVDDTDTWVTSQFPYCRGQTVNAFVKRGQLWGVARQRNQSYNLMSYDTSKKRWDVKEKVVPEAMHAQLFF